jgi:5-methylcytosine-specific restriction enzyme A
MKRRLLFLASLLCLVAAAIAAEPRSGHWPTLRAQTLKEHPTCAACGTTEHLTVHHVIPFHVDPSKELDPDNLIVLCERCHLVFGHLCDYQSYNPDVRADAAAFLAKVKARPKRQPAANPAPKRKPTNRATPADELRTAA